MTSIGTSLHHVTSTDVVEFLFMTPLCRPRECIEGPQHLDLNSSNAHENHKHGEITNVHIELVDGRFLKGPLIIKFESFHTMSHERK